VRLYVDALGVEEAYRRRGVSTRLMGAVEEWASAKGVVRDVLTTYHASPLSVPFYDLFGMETIRENDASSNWASDWDEGLLRHPVSGPLLGLLQHPANPGEPFSESRAGLDHLEFEVAGVVPFRCSQHPDVGSIVRPGPGKGSRWSG
jgi:Acetyltransferase (GNAT) domain